MLKACNQFHLATFTKNYAGAADATRAHATGSKRAPEETKAPAEAEAFVKKQGINSALGELGKAPQRRLWRMQQGAFKAAPRLAGTNVTDRRLAQRGHARRVAKSSGSQMASGTEKTQYNV